VLLAVCLAFGASYASAGVVTPPYQFDDVYQSGGASNAGAQWVVITNLNSTVGKKTTETIETGANFVRERSNIYRMEADSAGNPVSTDVVKYIFMVVPETESSINIDFRWLQPPDSPGQSYTQDILYYNAGGDNSYANTKESLLRTDGEPVSGWKFDFTKYARAGEYDTSRGYLAFHQNPSVSPSQTVQIPLIIANVRNGNASQKPLLFRSAMRERMSGGTAGARGNIVAYDHFGWNVAENYSPIGVSDWVFVPVTKLPIDDNQVNYDLRTDITNYSGLRYGLQRQDLGMGDKWMPPTRWRMDLPAGVDDVDPDVTLNVLSHVPPGLITTYDQSFNVVKGANPIMDLYPIDETTSSYRLTLRHPSIFGIDLGRESGFDFDVTGFSYLSSQSFLDRVKTGAGSKTVMMPTTEDSVMSGITSQTFLDSNAVNTLAVDAAIPRHMVISDDADGMLPLYVTLKISKDNQFMVSRWNALLTQWRSTGRIKTQFANQFSLYVHYPDGTNLDLFDWLQRNNEFDRTVKVFLDEEQGYVTISFIVMMMDSDSKDVSVVEDTTDNGTCGFIVMKDGQKNERWNTTFVTAPVGYIDFIPDAGGGSSGSGGGGCGVGVPISALMLLAAAGACWAKRRVTIKS
jgi:hypothetical protein